MSELETGGNPWKVLGSNVESGPDQCVVPIEFQPRVYGESELLPLELKYIIMLSQVRHEPNSEQSRLQSSIETQGLINNPEVARLDQDRFEAYLKVLHYRNRQQGMSEEDISGWSVHPDGCHYVVISGHSRILAISDNEAERSTRAAEAGYTTHPGNTKIVVKIIDNPDPVEIIARQIAENFHDRPPIERFANVMLSHYLYCRDTGIVNSRDEYLEMLGGALPKSAIDDVVAFSRLPPQAQEFVTHRSLDYSVAVALGRLQPKRLLLEGLKRYGKEYFVDSGNGRLELADEDKALLEELVGLWLGNTAAELYGAKLRNPQFGIGAQKQRLRNSVAAMDQEIASHLGPTLFGAAELEMVGAREQVRVAIRAARRQYESIINNLLRHPIEQIDAAVMAHLQLALLGEDMGPQTAEALRSRDQQIIAALARSGILGAQWGPTNQLSNEL